MFEEITEAEYSSREMYAQYGIAMYQAQMLEHRVAQTLALARTAAKQFETQLEVADDFSASALTTFGTLLRYLRPYLLDSGLETEMSAALETRNRLAHHFFRGHEGHHRTIEGHHRMTSDAYAAQLQFQTVMDSLVPVTIRFIDAIGLAPDEYIQGLGAAVQNHLAESAPVAARCHPCLDKLESAGIDEWEHWICPACAIAPR